MNIGVLFASALSLGLGLFGGPAWANDEGFIDEFPLGDCEFKTDDDKDHND